MNGKTENIEPNGANVPEGSQAKALPPAAQRALAEAQARRVQAEAEADALQKEEGGRGGHDPARYGDWEINGRAIDF